MQGINVKESKGEILLGINLEQFIETLRALPEKDGWVNLILSPLPQPLPKGYTHMVRPQKKRKNHGGATE